MEKIIEKLQFNQCWTQQLNIRINSLTSMYNW